MFTFKKKRVPTKLQEEIVKAELLLETTDAKTPEYGLLLATIEKLQKLQSNEKTGFKVSPDAALAAATSLLGIIIIISYEHAHTIVSKSLNFVPKV